MSDLRSRTDHLGQVAVPAPPRSGPQFPVLDTLRGVGALCVLVTHVAFWSGDYTQHGFWGTLLARLDVGVALFFVLSGFLLARPWLTSTPGRRPATGAYLWRRLLRIAPLYVVTAVLALSLLPENGGTGPGGYLRTLLLLDTFTDRFLPAGLTQMWSLAVEVGFYLVLPLVMVALLGRGRHGPSLPVARVLVGLAALLGVAVWWHLAGTDLAGRLGSGLPGQWLPGYLGWFAAGILLALVQVLHEQGRAPALVAPFTRLAAQPGSCWVLVLGLLLLAATPLAGPSLLEAPTGAQAVFKSLVYALVGLLVVLTGVFPRPGAYLRVLSHPLGRRLGYLSFGIFCLHLLVLHLVMAVSSWTLFAVPLSALLMLTLAGSLLAAEVSYRLVERPALRLRDVGPGRVRVDAAGRRTHRGHRGRSRSLPETSSAESGTSTTSDVHPS